MGYVRMEVTIGEEDEVRRDVFFLGEDLSIRVFVHLPLGQKFQGRFLTDWKHFFSNLDISVQLFEALGTDQSAELSESSVREDDGASESFMDATEMFTLVRMDTSEVEKGKLIGSPSFLGSGIASNTNDEGEETTGKWIESNKVAYSLKLRLSLERAHLERRLVMKVTASPPTFPMDEANFLLPSQDLSPSSHEAARLLHGLYSRSSTSRGFRPTYNAEFFIKVQDPLYVETTLRSSPMSHDSYVLAVVVQNRYPHDWSLAIDKVELSSPASSLTGWNIRWMGCEEENLILHRTEQQSIVCLLEPSSTQVSTLPESMQLVIWWRLRGGGGGESKMKVVDLHMGSVSRRLQGLDMQTSRDMNIMCSIRNNDKVVVGCKSFCEFNIKNGGNETLHILLYFPDSHLLSSPEAGKQDGALRCITRLIEVGKIPPKSDTTVSVEVMGLRAGMARMEACFLHDMNSKLSVEVFTHWATMVT